MAGSRQGRQEDRSQWRHSESSTASRAAHASSTRTLKALPEGQLLHLAGPTDDGWLIVAVHDSQASWERFRDDTLLPGLASVEQGLPGPPEEMTFEVQTFHTQHRST